MIKILLLALVGGVVVIAPGAAIPLGALAKLLCEAQNAPLPIKIPDETDPEKVRQSIYRLKKNEYLKIKSLGKNTFRFELTKKGRKLLKQYNFFDFRIKPKAGWDGQWRMFIFDVPERKKPMREALRKRLKTLGFFRFQKSVWIYPFECEKEMNYICEFLGVNPYTTTFTGKIPSDYLLRKHFIAEGVLKKSDLYKA